MEQANNPLPQTPPKPNEAKNFPKWVWLLLAVVSLLLLLWWINQSRRTKLKRHRGRSSHAFYTNNASTKQIRRCCC